MRSVKIVLLVTLCVIALGTLLFAATNQFGVADPQIISFDTPMRVGTVLLPKGFYRITHTMEGEDPIMVFNDRIGQRDIGGNITSRSLERDRQRGASLARNIEAQAKLITDPAITEYVSHVGQEIVRHSDAQTPFTIKVIESDEINAFVLPGGYLYVNSGLILASDNEAELAGILAHEIAHIAAQHARRIQRRRLIWSVAARCSGPVGFAVQVGGFLFSLKDVRNAEREADLLGMEYQYAAGYDPQTFIEFFEKLRARGKESHTLIARAFATHPMTKERIQRAEREISTLLPAKDQYVVDTSDFEETKARLGRLTAGPAESKDPQPVLRRIAPRDGRSVDFQEHR